MLSTDKQTNKQTDKLTNATKNITSFAKEVMICLCEGGLRSLSASSLIMIYYEKKCHEQELHCITALPNPTCLPSEVPDS